MGGKRLQDRRSKPGLAPAIHPESGTAIIQHRQSTLFKPGQTETVLSIIGMLVFKSQPLRLEQLLPYQESLVAHVYNVREILQGAYKEKQILVVHPAHIGLKIQPLEKYEIGKTYELPFG